MTEKKLIFDVEDSPKMGQLLIFALQQVLAIMAATIAVPAAIGLKVQMPAAIFGAGVGTIVYLLFTRSKSPVFLGSSFAFIDSLIAALAYGYLGIILGSILAGLVYVIIALVIRFVGTGWVEKLMPPVVIGPTVAIIGLSLAGSAMGDIVKASGDAINGSYNLIGLLCGFVTFMTVVLFSSQKKFKMGRLIPFVLGICAGYLVATVFTVIGLCTGVEYLKIINFTPIVSNFVTDEGAFVGFTAFLNYPDFALIEGIKELMTGEVGLGVAEALVAKEVTTAPTILNWTGVAEVAIAFIPVALVVFAEHIADHKNLSSIIGRDLLEDPGLKNTLLGDGVGSMAGTIFGICPNTTYGESVGCVAITRNASIKTIWVAAFMCIVLSFVRPLMVVLQSIPSCVMGGVCLTLYGFIAVSGLKMFKELDLNDNRNLFVVSAILIAGIGGLSLQIPYAIAENGAVLKVIKVTSVSTALILGIVTNLITGLIEKKNAQIIDGTSEELKDKETDKEE